MDVQISSVPECRICLDPSSSLPLIQPCLCSGTIGHVHTACLLQWVNTTKEQKCRICRCRYDLPWIKVPDAFNKYLLDDEVHRMGLIFTILLTALELIVHIASLKYCLINGFNSDCDQSLAIHSVMNMMYALLLMSLFVVNLSILFLVIQMWFCLRSEFKKWQTTHYTMRVMTA